MTSIPTVSVSPGYPLTDERRMIFCARPVDGASKANTKASASSLHAQARDLRPFTGGPLYGQ